MPGRYFCGELSVLRIGSSRNAWRRQLNLRRLKKVKGKRGELVKIMGDLSVWMKPAFFLKKLCIFGWNKESHTKCVTGNCLFLMFYLIWIVLKESGKAVSVFSKFCSKIGIANDIHVTVFFPWKNGKILRHFSLWVWFVHVECKPTLLEAGYFARRANTHLWLSSDEDSGKNWDTTVRWRMLVVSLSMSNLKPQAIGKLVTTDISAVQTSVMTRIIHV